MKVRFKRDYTVQGENGPSYTEGQIVEFSAASADHFIRRGVAEVVKGDRVETAAVEAPEKAVRGRGRPRKLSSDDEE